jgi:hypothetical protein
MNMKHVKYWSIPYENFNHLIHVAIVMSYQIVCHLFYRTQITVCFTMTSALHVIINMFKINIDEASFALTCQPILWVKWVSILIDNYYNPTLHYCCFKLIMRIHQFKGDNKSSCFVFINDMIIACSQFHRLTFLDCISKDYKCGLFSL